MDILLVEDNPADVRITEEALRDTDLPHALHVARDGVEALQFLRREDAFSDAVTPDLILLDLNMPRMSGLEVLDSVKSDPALRRIPVVVLTTSDAASDVSAAYDAHANSYVVKPVDLDRFIDVVGEIKGFWMETARRPDVS